MALFLSSNSPDCVCRYLSRRQDSLPRIRPEGHANDKRADATGALHNMITRELSCIWFRKCSICQVLPRRCDEKDAQLTLAPTPLGKGAGWNRNI